MFDTSEMCAHTCVYVCARAYVHHENFAACYLTCFELLPLFLRELLDNPFVGSVIHYWVYDVDHCHEQE